LGPFKGTRRNLTKGRGEMDARSNTDELRASAMPESTDTARTVTEHATGDRPLRILHLIILLGESNGQYNEHCLPLMHVRDLTVCTYFKPKLSCPAEIKVFPGDDTLRGFFRALGAALKGRDYDIIHAHAPETGALLMLALALRPGRWRFWRSLVYTVQDSSYDYDVRDKVLMLPTLAFSRRVVFCGQAAYDSYPALWKRLAGSRARIVQNAADFERVDTAIGGEERSQDDSTFKVVSVGRLEKVKDPFSLLAAFRVSRDDGSHLTYIGGGSLETQLTDEIRASRLQDRVQLTGLIPRDEVFVRCADADLFVSTSRGEGLPVAVLEAMAAGCPVILSDIPPHRELAEGADFIPFVRPGDSDAFAREIDRFRRLSPEERVAIGLKGRDLVRTRFGLATMHAGLENVYREIL
jgi:glycosyltransferase involved in cell wall biosynthesis